MSDKKNVFITGATQGIGYEFAKLFAKDRYSLFLVARSLDHLNKVKTELEHVYNANVTVFAKDLSEPSAAEDVAKVLADKSINIDILINNAGFGTHGEFVAIPLEDDKNQLNVNIVALTMLTKLLLSGMVKRGCGKILNVASTAAFQPGPRMAVYYATKAYVLSFSEALSEEVKGTGVTVTALCPGPTDTGFSKRATLEDSKLFGGMLPIMDPKQVAAIGYEGLMKGKRVVIPGFENAVSVFLSKLAPHAVTLRIIKQIQ